MPLQSPFPDLDIPSTNLLDYLFPDDTPLSDEPIWHDSVDPSISLSKRQIVHEVKRLSVGLDKLGVMEGECVMIFTPNHVFVPVTYLGVVGSRRVFSGANPIYTVPEVAYQIRNTSATLLLVHPDLVSTALAAAKAASFPLTRLYQFDHKPCPTRSGVHDWQDFLGTNDEAKSYTWPSLTVSSASTTIATINYSSGTTGLPKGVMVSHRNLIANAMQTMYARDWKMPYSPANRPAERWNACLPLYHAYGQMYTNIMSLKLNAKTYIMKKFEFVPFLEVIERFKITHIQVAPPIIVMLGRRPESKGYDLSSLKSILSGAAPLSTELRNEVAKRFNLQINNAWGMTELTCTAVYVPNSIPNDQTGSIGFLFPNCQGKLVDDEGKEVGVGKPGEVHIRGPNVCLGYWRNGNATEDLIDANGWLKTGDIGVFNEKGTFWIVDRKKELIKVNGLQVAPAELEAVLLEHEAVADAACVGIELHGEEWPRGYAVIKEDFKGKVQEEEIKKWVGTRVAKHKHLVGGLMFVDEVPKSPSGKIQRKIMREWAKKDVARMEGQIKARL